MFYVLVPRHSDPIHRGKNLLESCTWLEILQSHISDYHRNVLPLNDAAPTKKAFRLGKAFQYILLLNILPLLWLDHNGNNGLDIDYLFHVAQK